MNTQVYFNYEFDSVDDLIHFIEQKLSDENKEKNPNIPEHKSIKQPEVQELKFKDHINNINNLKLKEKEKFDKDKSDKMAE